MAFDEAGIALYPSVKATKLQKLLLQENLNMIPILTALTSNTTTIMKESAANTIAEVTAAEGAGYHQNDKPDTMLK